jgi:hypothetical protein
MRTMNRYGQWLAVAESLYFIHHHRMIVMMKTKKKNHYHLCNIVEEESH